MSAQLYLIFLVAVVTGIVASTLNMKRSAILTIINLHFEYVYNLLFLKLWIATQRLIKLFWGSNYLIDSTVSQTFPNLNGLIVATFSQNMRKL